MTRSTLANEGAHIIIILCYLGNNQKDLVPPSHFASSAQFAGPHRVVQIPGTTPPISWINPGVTSGDPSCPNPWLAISQAQQEILELRKENQRIVMLQKDNIRGRIPVHSPSDLRARYPKYVFFKCEECHYCLSVGWHIGNTSSPSFSNTDVKREMSSGPDGSQSGV